MRSANLHQLPDLMRTFEYKLMAYLETYHKLVEKNVHEEELDEKGEKVLVVDAKKAYNAQADFLKIIQTKVSGILSKQKVQHFVDQGYVMNHSSTKSMVEFLHAYLGFLTKFFPKINVQDNSGCIEFVAENLSNPLT
jgi:hypothetical protein